MDNSITYRECKDCGNPCPETEEYFPANIVKGKRYLRYYCRSCWRKRVYERDHAQWEVVSARKKKWRQENPEKVKEQKRRSHILNREHNNRRSTKWYHANKEREKPKRKRYYEENKAIFFARANARIHRRRANGGSFTQAEILELHENQGGMCFYCSEPLPANYHRDHIIPISRGGSNYISNIALTCPACNLSKSDKLPHEWSGRT